MPLLKYGVPDDIAGKYLDEYDAMRIISEQLYNASQDTLDPFSIILEQLKTALFDPEEVVEFLSWKRSKTV